jgi:hypothetical protein
LTCLRCAERPDSHHTDCLRHCFSDSRVPLCSSWSTIYRLDWWSSYPSCCCYCFSCCCLC